MLNKFIVLLKKEFTDYNSKKFTKDVIAGISVAAVALPLALAFGVASGAGAAAGLVATIVAGIVTGGLSGGSFQISGPSGAMSAVLLTTALTYGVEGIFISTFISGIILIICAFIKVAKIVSFIPTAVVTGFTSGIAIIIAGGQINNFFGVTSEGISLVDKVISYFRLGFNINFTSLAFGLLVVAIMCLCPKKINAIIPSSLIGIGACLAINMIFNLSDLTVGAIPQQLVLDNRLTMDLLNLDYLSQFLLPGITIAALCMIESLLCGASASKLKNESIDSDQELLAQGLGNAIIPFFGGIPSSAAVARSSVGIKSGSVTRITSIVQAFTLIAFMFVLGNIMGQIPLSALGGVLIVTGFRMNDWENIRYIFNNKFKNSIIQFFVTMIATVVFDLTTAVIIGLILSMLLFVVRHSDLDIKVANFDPKRMSNVKLKTNPEDIKLVYVAGPIFFGNQEKFLNIFEELKDVKYIILSMRGVPSIDGSAMLRLVELINKNKDHNQEIMLCGLQKQPLLTLTKINVENHEHISIYWDAINAITTL